MECILRIGPAITVDLEGIPNSLEGINSVDQIRLLSQALD